MFVYKIRVDMATHGEVMAGRHSAESAYYRIAADSDQEAVEVAVAWAHEGNHLDVMPTGVALLDFPC